MRPSRLCPGGCRSTIGASCGPSSVAKERPSCWEQTPWLPAEYGIERQARLLEKWFRWVLASAAPRCSSKRRHKWLSQGTCNAICAGAQVHKLMFAFRTRSSSVGFNARPFQHGSRIFRILARVSQASCGYGQTLPRRVWVVVKHCPVAVARRGMFIVDRASCAF